MQNTNNTNGKLFYINGTKTATISKMVKEKTDALRMEGSPLKTSVLTVAPIKFPIVVLDINGSKQAIIVNETHKTLVDSLHGEDSLDLLPDASILLDKDKLTEAIGDIPLEYCRVEDFDMVFDKIYNQIITSLTGGDGDRVGSFVQVYKKLNPNENKVTLSIQNTSKKRSINDLTHPVQAEYILSHFEDGVGLTRDLVVTNIKDVRSFRELSVVLANITDDQFYIRSGIDLTPLKELIIPGNKEEWGVEDMRLMSELSISIDVRRTSSTLMEELLRQISQGNKGFQDSFYKYLEKEFDFDFKGDMFDLVPFERVYGTIDTKEGVKRVEELTLAEALAMSKNPVDIENYLLGTYAGHIAFIKAINVNAEIDGALERLMLNPDFIQELKRAVLSTIKIQNPQQGGVRRESFYKQHTRANRYNYAQRGGYYPPHQGGNPYQR